MNLHHILSSNETCSDFSTPDLLNHSSIV